MMLVGFVGLPLKGELLMVTFAMLLADTNLVISVADAIPRFDVSKTCKAAIDLSGNRYPP